MVIVDTTVWIDYLSPVINPHTEWLQRSFGHKELGLTDMILSEVLQGIRTERQFRDTLEDLSAFDFFETGGRHIAIESAKNYRLLRSRGCTVRRTIDCIIATFCILEDHALLHRDRDFDYFEQYLGLRVIHPTPLN